MYHCSRQRHRIYENIILILQNYLGKRVDRMIWDKWRIICLNRESTSYPNNPWQEGGTPSGKLMRARGKVFPQRKRGAGKGKEICTRLWKPCFESAGMEEDRYGLEPLRQKRD